MEEEEIDVEPSGQTRYRDRATKILAELWAIQGHHLENHLLICRNHIAEALETFKQQTKGLTDKDPQFYVHYFELEQRVAFGLLNLYEHSKAPFFRILNKKNAVREKVSDITRQFYAEPLVAKDYGTDVVRDALIRHYQFAHHMMQFCENPRTIDREKFQVLALMQHIVNFSSKNSINDHEKLGPLFNQFLVELSHCENFSTKAIQKILINHISAVKRLGLEEAQRYLAILEESSMRLENIPSLINLSSVRGENKYSIQECFVSEKDLGKSEEYIFYGGEEDEKNPKPITEDTVFALMAIGLGILASSRKLSLKSDVLVTAEALSDARRKAQQNTVWMTQARTQAVEVFREWDASGRHFVQKSKDPHLEQMFNLTIQGKLRGESAVRQVFFIAVNGLLGVSQQVCCYSLEQAKHFIQFLKAHPFCYDEQNGWTMSQQDKLSTEETMIMMLCNTLASYLQSSKNHLEKPLNVAMVQEIKGLMTKLHQAEDLAAVLIAFCNTKEFCVNLIKLEKHVPEEHVIYQLLNRIESHLINALDKPLKKDPLYEKLNRLVEMDLDPFILLGVDFFYTPKILQERYQGLVSESKDGRVNISQQWAYEVLLKYPYAKMLEEAVVKASQFEPGILSKLLEVEGEFASSQTAIDKAYGRCLHEYMEGERDIGELHSIQQEYEFLSHPLQRKAWIERKSLMVGSALQEDVLPSRADKGEANL